MEEKADEMNEEKTKGMFLMIEVMILLSYYDVPTINLNLMELPLYIKSLPEQEGGREK